MRYGIVNLSLIPVRADKSDRSEMVNQLLFGEVVHILLQEDNWLRIRSTYDDYEGWIDAKQLLETDAATYNLIKDQDNYHLISIQATAQSDNKQVQLAMGASLPFYSNHSFTFINEKFNIKDGQVAGLEFKADEQNLLTVVSNYINAPYLWGGRSPFGIDCSGFTQVVFKFFGIKLKRDAYQQAEQGRAIDFVESAQPGDLAFFHNENKRIVHTGIILNGGEIVHASGKVRVDALDHHGIFNKEKGVYTHQLSCIKRVL